MKPEELRARMRTRIELCRNLAASTSDPRTAEVLRQMANEGEKDLKRLERESE